MSERSSTHEKRRTSPTKLDSKPVFELSKVLTKSDQAILEVISTVVAPLATEDSVLATEDSVLATEDSVDKVMKKLDTLDGKFNLLALYVVTETASKPLQTVPVSSDQVCRVKIQLVL